MTGPWWRNGGYKLDKCVRVGGPNDANNDQFSFYDCDFSRPVTACVQIDNSQSIWGKHSAAAQRVMVGAG